MITNRDLKKKVVQVLYDNYGFAPSMLKDIALIEADNKTGQFIKFQIGKFVYLWDSCTLAQLVDDTKLVEDTDRSLDRYQNIETGDVVIVLDINDKYKTVMVEYDSGMTRSMALSMFKKLWKPINKKEEN